VVEYAGEKAASVRALQRTSGRIPVLNGAPGTKTPPQVLAGVFTTSSDWTPPLGKQCVETLKALPSGRRLQIGIALEAGAFDLRDDSNVEVSGADSGLVFLYLKLLGRLQGMGNPPAIDYAVYADHLLGAVCK